MEVLTKRVQSQPCDGSNDLIVFRTCSMPSAGVNHPVCKVCWNVDVWYSKYNACIHALTSDAGKIDFLAVDPDQVSSIWKGGMECTDFCKDQAACMDCHDSQNASSRGMPEDASSTLWVQSGILVYDC